MTVSVEVFNFSNTSKIKEIILGEKEITLSEFVAVARYNAKVVFSENYCERTEKSRKLLVKLLKDGRSLYGVTTGFGYNFDNLVDLEYAAKLQKNILLSHACSVGEPLDRESVRGIMLMMLLNLGQGYSGVRLDTLKFVAGLLNNDITPYAPSHGSVGYLSVEAHIALLTIEEGKAFYKNQLLRASEALGEAMIAAPGLEYKEGLALISGTTSVTALAALSLYDTIKTALTLDIVGAMNLEALKGTIRAFNPKLQNVRRHEDQKATAANILKILENSEITQKHIDYRLQDALSLRCIPQLHGAVKKTLKDAYETIIHEMNSCCDNPILYPLEQDDGEILTGCNADGAYVGIAADSIAIAAVNLAKMSERRIARILNQKESDLPAFLVENSGLNSGYMISQYTAAGILGEMRVLAHPSTIDNIPTSANQEDYVSMGYNASKKALQVSELLEIITAIELLVSAQGLEFLYPLKSSTAIHEVRRKIRTIVPKLSEDMLLYPYIEAVQKLIHEGSVIQCVENITEALEF